jgi:hypothetical protein
MAIVLPPFVHLNLAHPSSCISGSPLSREVQCLRKSWPHGFLAEGLELMHRGLEQMLPLVLSPL